ncbi:hypothetical protein HY932_00695 [Candidatus Falkowbacteria bacterium]|nr:hypothetical protein [Candidatus Falkowbacteria bacterium]
MEEQYLKEQEKFTEKELKWSYWVVVNKDKLKKSGTITLAIVAGILFLYGSIGLLFFYSYQYKELDNLQKQIIAPKLNYSYLQEKNNPLPVEIGEVTVLKTKADKFDIVVEARNPNQSWYLASFDYYFLVGTSQTRIKTSFLLPSEDRYLAELNWTSQTNFSDAQIVLENLKWQKKPDFENLKAKVWKFAIDNADFVAAQQLGLAEEVAISQVKFNVANQSAYNFSRVDFVVLLFRGSQIVGATITALDEFKSEEAREVKINFYYSLGSVDSVLVAPVVDILNPSSFMAFEKTAGELK